MPITPFLNGERFDLEGERVLRLAFEMVCVALRTGDCDDYVKQAIATKLIALAKAGERNPDLLCQGAIEQLRWAGGHRVDVEELGGFHATVTGDDLPVIIDQDRIAEAELRDAVRDLADLLLRMRPGIVRVWPQIANTSKFNFHRNPFFSVWIVSLIFRLDRDPLGRPQSMLWSSLFSYVCFRELQHRA